MSDSPRPRRLTLADLPAVTAVQRLCYRDELIESAAAFRGKLLRFPAGCLHYATGVPATYMMRWSLQCSWCTLPVTASAAGDGPAGLDRPPQTTTS